MNIKAVSLILLIILAQILTACAGPVPSPTATPSVVPTPTTDPLQSAKIVQAFWDALEAGDLETAMVYVDDNASCAGSCYFTGKTAFQNYLKGYLEGGYSTRISDVKSVGSIVTYSWEAYRNENFLQRGDNNEMMQVEEGKIIYWENHHR